MSDHKYDKLIIPEKQIAIFICEDCLLGIAICEVDEDMNLVYSEYVSFKYHGLEFQVSKLLNFNSEIRIFLEKGSFDFRIFNEENPGIDKFLDMINQREETNCELMKIKNLMEE